MEKSKRINAWIKENKWRLQVILPKQYETPVKARAKATTGGSVSEYIRKLIESDIKDYYTGGGEQLIKLIHNLKAAVPDHGRHKIQFIKMSDKIAI